MQAVHGQREFTGSVRMRDDVAAEILPVGLLGPWGARGRIEQALFVVSSQAEAADGFIGCGAAGAAEPPSGP